MLSNSIERVTNMYVQYITIHTYSYIGAMKMMEQRINVTIDLDFDMSKKNKMHINFLHI